MQSKKQGVELAQAERRNKMLERTAICGSLAILAAPAIAQSAPAEPPSVAEVVVTATRRSEDVTKVPYNISVVSPREIESRGVTTFEDLTRQIPNLNLNAAGDRTVGSQRPVMRGLNASSTDRQGAALEQAPVATYLGNVPFGDLFPITDVERVEVLRGPQGTLYGAGALGGALRIIPTEPQLSHFGGSVEGALGGVYHASKIDRSIGGTLNVPVGDTLAFRVSAKHQYDAGFIDRYGVMVRQNGPLSAPVLANPSDPAGSSAAFRKIDGANWGWNTSVRGSVKWQPTDDLKVIAAYDYAHFKGNGGPEDDPHFRGGPYPVDPNVVFPATGKYEVIVPYEEPYDRTAHMSSVDVSYDAGFATLSSTTSYTTTSGFNQPDVTYLYLNLPPSYQDYYVGNPRNPRFNGQSIYQDDRKIFTQEVRIVSRSGGPLDYVAGGYFQRELTRDNLSLIFPGQADFAAATGQFFLTGPDGLSVLLAGKNKFTDKAIFGELTWHITPRWQITGGARIFWQDFTRNLDILLYTFNLPPVAEANSSSIRGKAIFKANTSFEIAPGQNAYATFSQGFRRGGPNTFATTGVIREDPDFLIYKPDTVDNYELGIKGRISGFRYNAALFWDAWNNPQIGLLTPVNRYPVVFNGKKARTRGFEVELNKNVGDKLSLSASLAYVEATLLQSFCIPTGTAVPDPNSPTGDAILDPCGIRGEKGGRLPGSAKYSANLGALYTVDIGDDNHLSFDLNAQYNGSILTSLPYSGLPDPPVLPSYWITNGRVSIEHKQYQIAFYVRNILNRRALLSTTVYAPDLIGPIDRLDTITRPRQIGVEAKYTW